MSSSSSSDKIFILLTTSEEAQIVISEPKNTLKQLQDLVGGYIETSPSPRAFGITSIPSRKGYQWMIVVGEEGIIKEDHHNPFTVEHLFGDIVVAQLSPKGDTAGFPREDIELLPQRIKRNIKK